MGNKGKIVIGGSNERYEKNSTLHVTDRDE